jgi:uncharacterized membrane protein
MQLIYFLFTFSLFWLHVTTLTAIAGTRFGSWAIARATSILIVVLAGFCVEHIIGLGSLRGVWFVTTVFSIFYLWVNRENLIAQGFLKGELIFACCLVYPLLWRFLYPTIYNTSERITDLVFINNYLPGDTLPPLDRWMPPYHFDFYYSVMHYGAALAGRILQMPNGVTYNFCFIFLTAMSLALAWDFMSRFITKLSLRFLLIAAIACGGTGASIVNHFITDTSPGKEQGVMSYVIGSARFIGGYEKEAKNELGRKFFPNPTDPAIEVLDLGVENFGYQFFVGDYHPPVAGYFILFLSLALIAALEVPAANSDSDNEAARLPTEEQLEQGKQRDQLLQFILAFCVISLMGINAWNLPLQGLLVASWVGWRTLQARSNPLRKPNWTALIWGGLFGLLLLYPYLDTFTNREVTTPIAFVKATEHTPIPQFIGQFWPLLILLGLGFVAAKNRPLLLFFTLFFIVIFAFTETIYVDDTTGGNNERLNSTMKWWGWIWTGSLLTLGSLLLANKSLFIKTPAIIALIFISTHLYDIGTYWKNDVSSDMGHFDGTDVWTRDPIYKRMFRYLRIAPDGIVVENHYGEGYHEGGAFSAFAGKPLLIGWITQNMTWHGWSEEIGQLYDGTKDFYAGKLLKPADWLLSRDVAYIIWNQKDAEAVSPEVWQKLATELEQAYLWKTFGSSNNKPIGIWIRKPSR